MLELAYFYLFVTSLDCGNSIQYVRHLHDRMNVLENRTAPPKEEDTSAADAAAAAMGYGMGMMMGQDTLMITNAPAGYGTIPSCFSQYLSYTLPDNRCTLSHLFLYQAATVLLVTALAPASPTPTASPRATATAALLPAAMVRATIKQALKQKQKLPQCQRETFQ